MSSRTCNKRYGSRNHLICRLPVHHRGRHSQRKQVVQLENELGITWNRIKKNVYEERRNKNGN